MELEIQDVVKDAIASGLENIKGVDSTVLPPSKATEQAALEHIRNIVKLGSKSKSQDAGESRHSFMLSACTTGWRYQLGGHITPEQGLDAILDGKLKRLESSRSRMELCIPYLNTPSLPMR
jgi:hypothetical protein